MKPDDPSSTPPLPAAAGPTSAGPAIGPSALSSLMGAPASDSSLEEIDQMGRTVRLPRAARRIVSLVPSQTELLFDLGLDTEAVVGVTRYCTRPAERVQGCTDVGGTKRLRHDVIESLAPDLVIGNKEENEQGDIERLAARYPVWMSDVETLDQAFGMIRSIGVLTDRVRQADAMAHAIENAFRGLTSGPPATVAYLIWQKPYMAVGRETFIHDMLARCGWTNLFADDRRYPTFELDTLEAVDVIFLSTEPFRFSSDDVETFRARFPAQRVFLVDGEIFSWYGSRLLKAPTYFERVRAALERGDTVAVIEA